MTIVERRRVVRRNGYCQNCLARSHNTTQCTSTEVCQRCGREHHTLLHLPVRLTVNQDQQHQRRRQQSHQQKNRQQQHERQHQRGRKQRQQLQQQQHRNDISQHQRINPLNDPIANPRRLLRGALKALAILEKAL